MIVSSDEIIYFGDLAFDIVSKRNICDMTKFHLIPHAVNVEICPREFKNNHRFVYASRLESGKGIEYLCEALAGIDEQFTFDIIGGGRLYRIINEKYGNSFRIHGYKDKGYVLEYLKNADFFILPSFSEHCPVVVLEGVAFGCIPLLSNFGNLSELIRENSSGIVFDIESQHDLFVNHISNAVGKALKMDVNRANKMICTNYELLHRVFSSEIMLSRTLEVFKKE